MRLRMKAAKAEEKEVSLSQLQMNKNDVFGWFFFVLFCFFWSFFRAAPVAYGSSQTRG